MGDGISYFGVNEVEKAYYKPGTNAATELSNIDKFFVVSDLIDRKNTISSTPRLKEEWAKFSSYPTFVKYRKMNIGELKKSKKILEEMGLNHSKYFYFYYFMLLIFGVRFCQWGVNLIRRIHGGRPNL